MIDLDRRSLHVATDPRGLRVKGHRRETEARSGQAMPKPKAEPARFLLWTRQWKSSAGEGADACVKSDGSLTKGRSEERPIRRVLPATASKLNPRLGPPP